MWKTTPLLPATDRLIRPDRVRLPGPHADRPRLAVVCATLALAASLVLPASASHAQTSADALDEVVVYDDALRPGMTNWSSATTDLTSTDRAGAGAASIRADMAAGQRVFLGNYVLTEVEPRASLVFEVFAGENTSVDLLIGIRDAQGVEGPPVAVTASGAAWTTIEVPLVDLGSPTTLGAIWWEAASDLAPLWIDDVHIGASSVAAPPAEEPPTEQPPAEEPPTAEPPVEEPPAEEPPVGQPPTEAWTFEETFDGDPAAPSQDLLPRTFDYMVTHRTHPQDQFVKDFYPTYQADHGDTCMGPNPEISPLPSHEVRTTQDSTGADPDPSFFICKDHMMSSMGEVDAYSVSAFWPRQEFNFADGATLEFDVNINEGHTFRHWWEVMIVPRDQLRYGAGPVDSAIDETYPEDRIVLTWRRNVRGVKVGTGAIAPEGWIVNAEQRGQYDWAYWGDLHPDDPALTDRRIRRTMRVTLDGDRIVWGVQTDEPGVFDEYVVDVPGGLPFDQGIVMFKTHSYTPAKDGNTEFYSFHWDNIRFDGPYVAPYSSHWADGVVDLQRNGDEPIGNSTTVSVDLPATGPNPFLSGQLHQPVRGQVLLSINGGPSEPVILPDYVTADCWSKDWKSFQLELDPAQLQVGENTLTWTVGPRPGCADEGIGFDGPGAWDGFAAKALHVQLG